MLAVVVEPASGRTSQYPDARVDQAIVDGFSASERDTVLSGEAEGKCTATTGGRDCLGVLFESQAVVELDAE